MNGEIHVRGKALAGVFTTCILVASLMMFAKGAPAEAHAPGGQRVDLTPVVIYDGDMRREIHISCVADYSRQRAGVNMSTVDVSVTFRAMQAGLEALWRSETPKRDDIKVISALPSYCSVAGFEFLTGAGAERQGITAGGDFSLVLPDGTEVRDRSFQNLRLLLRDVSLENYRFTFIRPSTGESLTIAVKEDVFPAGFLELQKKALFGIPERATVLELEREGVLHTQVTEQFLASPAWQLFEGAKMPYPWVGGVVAFGLLLIVAAAVYARLLKKYRAGCARQ